MHAKYGSRELASSGGGGSLLKGVSNRICRFRPSSSCSTPLARLQLTFPGQHPAIRKRASPVLPLGLHLAKCATPFCAHCNVINCHPVHNPTLLLHSAHFTLYPLLYRTPSSWTILPICSGLLFLKLRRHCPLGGTSHANSLPTTTPGSGE